MWYQCLIHNDNLLPAPFALKNPNTNLPFEKHHLYNIYFSALWSNYQIPLYIREFFNLDFDLDLFQMKYYLILQEIAIDEYLNSLSDDELFNNIRVQEL